MRESESYVSLCERKGKVCVFSVLCDRSGRLCGLSVSKEGGGGLPNHSFCGFDKKEKKRT